MRRAIAIVVPVFGLVFVSWCQTFLGAAAVVAVPACSTADAGGYTPITGIVVLSDTLTAGHGCGSGPGEVYKYVSIVTSAAVPGVTAGGAYIAGGVSDCYAQATFNNLCATSLPDGGTENIYNVSIYAFTATQWDSTFTDDGGSVPYSNQSGILYQLNGFAAPVSNNACVGFTTGVGQLLTTLGAQATWTAQCTATQQADIPVTATCTPLQPVLP